jgi:hypothetical protein
MQSPRGKRFHACSPEETFTYFDGTKIKLILLQIFTLILININNGGRKGRERLCSRKLLDSESRGNSERCVYIFHKLFSPPREPFFSYRGARLRFMMFNNFT